MVYINKNFLKIYSHRREYGGLGVRVMVFNATFIIFQLYRGAQ